MADKTLNIRFGVISHGWLPITFCIFGDDALVEASDVPADPIAQLVSLSRFLLSPDHGSRDAEFHLEPEYCVLTATETNDPAVADLRLIQPGRNLSASLPCLETATQIWRAICGIESALLAAINSEQWSWEFPVTQMQMLASEIETAKSAH